MNGYCPNPYLDELQSIEKKEQAMQERLKRNDFRNRAEKPVLVHRVDPIMGRYMQMSWAMFSDEAQEIAVVTDGFFPGNMTITHSHDFFEIVYVYSGCCQTKVSGQEIELHAGDLCLFNLYAVHRIEFSNSDDGVFNIIIRKDLFRRQLLELLSGSDLVFSFFLHILYDRESSDNYIYLHPDEQYYCVPLAQQIVETFFRKEPVQQLMLKHQLSLLLIEIARQYRGCRISEQDCSSSDFDIEAVIRYINAHYMEATKEDVAKHFGYSVRSLTRLLKKYTGDSFREIVQNIRFDNARAMLQENRMSIEEIAFTLGYRDRSNFENAFKKYCHITPSAYRKQFCLK